MALESKYLLETLRDGADFTLYRGSERGDNPTPIFAVAVNVERPSSQNLQRLEYECSLATKLDESWAAQPIELTRHQGRTILVLRDPGGEFLDRVMEQLDEEPIELAQFLRIAIGMAAALGKAHQQGIIHKDVKPENVIVDDASRVWLTGFGIASRLPRERRPPTLSDVIDGSLAYMSPEQTPGAISTLSASPCIKY
jgi:serine/threonine protein kinase